MRRTERTGTREAARRAALLVGLCFLAATACHDDPVRPAGGSRRPSAALTFSDDLASPAWHRDAVTIERASIVGDELRLEVTYAGGCEPHDFSLVVDRAFMESAPVQVAGLLAHDAHGDACSALVTRALAIDLTPLERHYRESYRTAAGSLVLQLRAPDASLRYDF